MNIYEILWRIAIVIAGWLTTEMLNALKKWLKNHFQHKKK